MGDQPMRLAFVDIETTSLDRETAEVWDIAIITRDPGPNGDRTQTWTWWPDLTQASPDSLRITGFYQRMYELGLSRPGLVRYTDSRGSGGEGLTAELTAAEEVARTLTGAFFVAAVPDFDAHHLGRWLRSFEHVGAHHYHLADVESMVVGYLRGAFQAGQTCAHEPHDEQDVSWPIARPPWNHGQLCKAVGIDPDAYERHTALGDARCVRDVWDTVMG